MEQLQSDPFNIEAQKMIEKAIQDDNISRNLEAALESNPESFGRIEMLYIRCTIEGETISAFVDTGAQATISKNQKMFY